MKIGFTGTRHGMTNAQKDAVLSIVTSLQPRYFNHGDCVGADVEAHDIVRQAAPECYIYAYPAIDRPRNRESDWSSPSEKPLERNRIIVDQSDAMIATPYEEEEMRRGGTWFTVRYTRKKGKPLYLVLPNGKVVQENVHG